MSYRNQIHKDKNHLKKILPLIGLLNLRVHNASPPTAGWNTALPLSLVLGEVEVLTEPHHFCQ